MSGVPPSDAPRTGHTDERDADARYANETPLDEYCSPLADTSTTRDPAPDDAGDAHSSSPTPTRRDAAVAPLDSKRQRTVAHSRKLEPSTETRVPPDTGPDDGATSLTYKAACT